MQVTNYTEDSVAEKPHGNGGQKQEPGQTQHS